MCMYKNVDYIQTAGLTRLNLLTCGSNTDEVLSQCAVIEELENKSWCAGFLVICISEELDDSTVL